MRWAYSKKGCGHSGDRTLKLAVSQEGSNGMNWFLHTDTNSGKLKVILIIFVWSLSKKGMVLILGTLKPAPSQEWIDELRDNKFRKV